MATRKKIVNGVVVEVKTRSAPKTNLDDYRGARHVPKRPEEYLGATYVPKSFDRDLLKSYAENSEEWARFLSGSAKQLEMGSRFTSLWVGASNEVKKAVAKSAACLPKTTRY